MRRRDDRYYLASALGTLVFYAAVLAISAGVAYFARWWAVAGLLALLAWLYKGSLFGAVRWPRALDVERIARREEEKDAERSPLSLK